MIRITDNGVSYILQGILLTALVPGFFHYRQFIFMNGYCSNWYYLGKQLLETLLHGIVPSSTNVLFQTMSAGGLQEEQIGSFKYSMVNEKKFVFSLYFL